MIKNIFVKSIALLCNLFLDEVKPIENGVCAENLQPQRIKMLFQLVIAVCVISTLNYILLVVYYMLYFCAQFILQTFFYLNKIILSKNCLIMEVLPSI